MSEIDAMKSVEDALKPLEKDEIKRVIDWACARYLGVQATDHSVKPDHKEPSINPRRKKSTNKKGKGKVIPKQIKNLNLKPNGKESGVNFALEKKPTNVMQKCVVAVYYLRDVLELPAISADHVFTFFKNATWKVPSDLINTLQQAGTAGWLDTADSKNIIITPIGENLVEHDLPKPVK